MRSARKRQTRRDRLQRRDRAGVGGLVNTRNCITAAEWWPAVPIAAQREVPSFSAERVGQAHRDREGPTITRASGQ